MTDAEGHFATTAVHERPQLVPGLTVQVDAERPSAREVFTCEVRGHLAVLGPGVMLDRLASAHRWPTLGTTPTEKLFLDYAKVAGWGAVIHVVANVIGEARDAQAASRA